MGMRHLRMARQMGRFQRKGDPAGSNGNNMSKGSSGTATAGLVRAGGASSSAALPSVIRSPLLRVWSLPPSGAHRQWGEIRQTRLGHLAAEGKGAREEKSAFQLGPSRETS